MTNTYNDFYGYLIDNDIISIEDFDELIAESLAQDTIGVEAFDEASEFIDFHREERLAPPIDMEPDIFQMLIRETLNNNDLLQGASVEQIIDEMEKTSAFRAGVIFDLRKELDRQLEIFYYGERCRSSDSAIQVILFG